MTKFKAGTAKLLLLGVMVALATPAAAARVEVNANTGHYPLRENGGVSNNPDLTERHSIENVTPNAGSLGTLVRRDNGVVTINGPGSSAPRWEIDSSGPGAVARAYGDLSTGKVGAYAGTGSLGYASAGATIADTLTFNIAGADAATITPIRFLVTLHAATPDAGTLFRFQADFGRYQFFGALNQPYFTSYVGWSESRTWVVDSTRYFDLVYNVQGANPTFGVEMTLGTAAGLGEVSDFYHTGGLQIQAQRGVTFTSGSGVFLTAGGVPEPATWAMMIIGFGIIGAVSRQRRTAHVA